MDFIDLTNYQNIKLIDGVVIRELKRSKRGDEDPRGYLVELFREDWADLKYDSNKAVMTYSSFTYKGVARDEDKWHIHPPQGNPQGLEQFDRWTFIGKAVAAVADPSSKKLNLFQIGTGWGDKGFFEILIPPNLYHGFLSAGGVLDDAGKEGVWILNWPDKLYNYDNPGLIEGRTYFSESGVKIGDLDFSWNEVRKALEI